MNIHKYDLDLIHDHLTHQTKSGLDLNITSVIWRFKLHEHFAQLDQSLQVGHVGHVFAYPKGWFI